MVATVNVYKITMATPPATSWDLHDDESLVTPWMIASEASDDNAPIAGP